MGCLRRRRMRRHRLTNGRPWPCSEPMSFASQRISGAWHHYNVDPCAKTMVALARLLSQHQYDPKWPCHAWICAGHWTKDPWRARWHSALLNSLRTSAFVEPCKSSALHRLCQVAHWPEEKTDLTGHVRADAWCSLEWWTLGTWLDQKMESPQNFVHLVSMWEPVWAIEAPAYRNLGWKSGLVALHNAMQRHTGNELDQIDGSTWWSLE